MGSAQYVWELSRTALCDADGIVFVLRVFMDESGTHGGSPVLTVGAAWAKPSVWKKWTKDWNLAKKPINVHHSTDCHNRNGEYKDWSRERRDAYVKRILPVIGNHGINGRISGIHLESFKKEIALRPKVVAVFGKPYIVRFQWAISDICAVALNSGTKQVAFIHEHNDYENDACVAFNHVRARFPDMALSITFACKREFVPLQCADVLAFEGNRRLRTLGAARRLPLEVIDPTWDRIGYIEYDEKNMPEFVSSMCRLYDVLAASGVPLERSSLKPARKPLRSRQRQASERSR